MNHMCPDIAKEHRPSSRRVRRRTSSRGGCRPFCGQTCLISLVLRSLLVAAVASLAAGQQIPVGVVTEKVICAQSPKYSYALYVPTGYKPETPSPVLFLFDPAARGKETVELAKNAAQEFGVIVAASNDSKNGPFRDSLDAGQAMVSDLPTRVNIDGKRVYTGGFSGGARVAVLAAMACDKCISAVMANGAGFPQTRDPKFDVPFMVFTTIGDMDFNYMEIAELREKLAKNKVRHRNFVFPSLHSWPPEEGWKQALAWISMHEMKSGIVAKDAARISAAYRLFLDDAKRLKEQNDLLNAMHSYEDTLEDFAGLADTAEAQHNIARIRESAEYKTQVKQQRDFVSEERAVGSDTVAQLRAIADGPDEERKESLQQLRAKMASLRKKIDAEGERKSPLLTHYRRTLSGMFAAVIEVGAEPLMRKRQYDLALELYDAITDFAKIAPGAYLGKARAYAAMGKQKQALEEAKTALAKGVPPDALRATEELKPLLSKPEWQALLTTAN